MLKWPKLLATSETISAPDATCADDLLDSGERGALPEVESITGVEREASGEMLPDPCSFGHGHSGFGGVVRL